MMAMMYSSQMYISRNTLQRKLQYIFCKFCKFILVSSSPGGSLGKWFARIDLPLATNVPTKRTSTASGARFSLNWRSECWATATNLGRKRSCLRNSGNSGNTGSGKTADRRSNTGAPGGTRRSSSAIGRKPSCFSGREFISCCLKK